MRGGRALVLVLLVSATSLCPVLARADAIPLPMCPPYAEPASFCHGPPTCAPRGCTSSRDCSAGERCTALELCIGSSSCGGSTRDDVIGLCSDGCTSGTCRSTFVCARGGDPIDAGIDAGRDASTGRDASGLDAGDGRELLRYGCDCHCSVGASRHDHGARDAGHFALVLALLGAVGWRRRRRISQSTPLVSG